MKDYSNYYPSFREVILENGKMIFEQQLQGFEGRDVLIDGVPTKALIQYHTNPLNDEKEDRKITCWRDININVGSYVKTLDDNVEYIVTTKVKKNDLVKYTKIIHCNHVFTVQDKDTLKIHSFSCYAGDKTSVYSSGINENKHIYTTSDQLMIIVPANEITNKIPFNERIIFNHDKNSVYSITRIDSLTHGGVIYFRAKHEIYDENIDNLKLNISNYIEPNSMSQEPQEPQETGDYKIKINGYDSIVFGMFEYYTVEIYRDNIKIDKAVKFELLGDKKLAWIADVKANKCKIYANKNRIKGTVVFRISLVEDESVYSEKEIKIVAW